MWHRVCSQFFFFLDWDFNPQWRIQKMDYEKTSCQMNISGIIFLVSFSISFNLHHQNILFHSDFFLLIMKANVENKNTGKQMQIIIQIMILCDFYLRTCKFPVFNHIKKICMYIYIYIYICEIYI